MILGGKTFSIRILRGTGSIVCELPTLLSRSLMPLLFLILYVQGWDQGEVSVVLTSSAKCKCPKPADHNG